MGYKTRKEKWQRALFLVAMLSVIAIFTGVAGACLPAPKVNAAVSYATPKPYPVPTPSPSPTPKGTPTPTPTVPAGPELPRPVFKGVYMGQTSFPQGTNVGVYGRVINIFSSVSLRISLKRYYNSSNAYTVQSWTDTMGANSSGVVYLQNSSVIKYSLNLASRPAGNYVLEIVARDRTTGQESTPMRLYFCIT